MYLKSRYPAEKLFVVSTDYTAKETMDLSISCGTIVGIVKDKDPLGGGDRWFVDTGETKGFLPCSILKRFGVSPTNVPSISSQSQHQYQATIMPPPAYEQPQPFTSGSHYSELLDLNLGESSTDPTDDASEAASDYGATAEPAPYYCNLDDIVSPELPESDRSEKTLPKRYRALYDFDGMGSNTLPINKDNVVEFLIGHNQEGNDK